MKKYSDIVGDGGSNIIEQLVVQRKTIDSRLAGVRNILAVGSGKGGVGKSTITMQLALALTAASRRVGVLDVDLNGPSIAHISGLQDRLLVPEHDGFSIPKSVDGIPILSVGSFLPEGAALEFDSVAVGASYSWRQTQEFSMLVELLQGANWGELDLLLVDLPPGPERTFQFMEFFGPKTNLLLVTIPSSVAAGVVSRSVAAARRANCSIIGYVENMSGYLGAGCKALQPLFPRAEEGSSANSRAFGLECLGTLAFDPGLSLACDS